MERRGLWQREIPFFALVLAMLAMFLVAVRPVLSPLVIWLALLVLLSPFSGMRSHRLILLVTGAFTFLWLLNATGPLLAPFILAMVLAYILDPAVDALVRRRVPRGLAILLLALPVIGLTAAAAVVGFPALVRELERLIARAPEAIRGLGVWAEQAQGRILGMEIPFVDEREVVRRIQAIDAERVGTFLRERQAAIAAQAWDAVLGVSRGVSFFFGLLGYIVLTPVLAFYLLRDWHSVTGRVANLVPVGRRDRWIGFMREYDSLLSGYLRGQLVAAAIVGVLTWLGLWILGFPYAGLVGAVAGVFNIVPYMGLVASLIPALVIALFSGEILASLLKVGGVFVVVQFLDGTVIGPRIVGGSVGLHPVWVILALAVGGSFYGFAGLLLAVPVAVLVKLVLREALARYERSAAFLGDRSRATDAPALPEPPPPVA